MVEPRAGVDHRDDDAGAARELPRAGKVEHGAGRDRPLLALARVGGAATAGAPA